MTKHTTQLETEILTGFAEGFSLRIMCHKAGISRSAFLKWLHGDPDLARRYEDAQLFHAEALVDDCLAIADDPMVALGEGRQGDVGGYGDILRNARFRMDSRLKIARIYFKRHEAALARRAAEQESPVPARTEEPRPEPPVPHPPESAAVSAPNRKARRAAKASARHAPALPLAAVSPGREVSARQFANTG